LFGVVELIWFYTIFQSNGAGLMLFLGHLYN
jgi:hypothetical protein